MSLLGSLRRELPGILPLFGPLLISQYAGIANGVVDTAMAARLGTLELGSVSVGVAIWIPLHLFTLGVLYGSLILISQRSGAGDREGVRKISQQAMWLGLFLGSCAALAICFLSYRIHWFGAAADLVAPAGEYMRMVAPGLPFAGVAIALRFFCEGQKVVIPVTVMSVLMVCVNAFLNYCLMFGNFGAPALGLRGCGLATALSSVAFLCMAALYIRFAKGSPGRNFFRSLYVPERAGLREIAGVGVPIGFGITSEYLVFTVITLFIATVGTVAVAAHQVCFSSMMLLFATPSALSVAASIRVGGLQGGNDPAATREAIRGIMMLGGLIGLAFTGVMIGFAEPLIRIFTTDPAVLPLAVSVLYVAALFQFSDAVQVCLNGFLRGAGDTAVPFYLTAATYWLFCLPLGYVLSGMPLPFGLGLSPELFGIRGWWMSLTVSLSLVALLLALRVRRIFWATAAEHPTGVAPAQGQA